MNDPFVSLAIDILALAVGALVLFGLALTTEKKK